MLSRLRSVTGSRLLAVPLLMPAMSANWARADPPATATTSPIAKFEKEMEAYEASDKTSPPPQGAVLFIGDAGIKKCTTLATDFPANRSGYPNFSTDD